MQAAETEDVVGEARMLLQQALRLLEDHVRVVGGGAALGTRTELAADLAFEAVHTLRREPGDVLGDDAAPDGLQGWAG